MHAIDLADLAATFVRAAIAQVALGESNNRTAQQDYWLTSRYRHEYWMRELSRHREQLSRPGASARARHWHEVVPIMQDILLSEPLTRVVAYHSAVLEQQGIEGEFSPLAHSALATHVEARNRCLHLIVFGPGLPVEDAVSLNRLRRILESYADELLGCLPPIEHRGLYCFEPRQVAGTQLRLSAAWQSSWFTLHVLSVIQAFRQTIRHELDMRPGNARLNYQLSQHVLRLSTPTCFDGLGVPFSADYGKLRANSLEAAATTARTHPLWQPITVRPDHAGLVPPFPPPRDR